MMHAWWLYGMGGIGFAFCFYRSRTLLQSMGFTSFLSLVYTYFLGKMSEPLIRTSSPLFILHWRREVITKSYYTCQNCIGGTMPVGFLGWTDGLEHGRWHWSIRGWGQMSAGDWTKASEESSRKVTSMSVASCWTAVGRTREHSLTCQGSRDSLRELSGFVL